MLHRSEFEHFSMPFVPEWSYDEMWANFGCMPLDEEPFMDIKSRDVMLSADVKEAIEELKYTTDDWDSLPMTAPYDVYKDHSYSNVTRSPSPIVNVWSSDETCNATPPPRKTLRRKTKTAKSVSIKKAAKTALKRTRKSELPQKRRKFDNSVETTPSSSDYEDVRSRNRDAKCTAIRAINGYNSNTKAAKSEVQRTNHNRNEKKRREVMSNMMKKVRFLIPAEFYRERTEKARAKASKQKILVACRAYVIYLKETEAKNAKVLKTEKKQVQIINRRLIKKWEQLKCQLNALSCRLNKF